MTRTAPRFFATAALTLAVLASGSTIAAASKFAPLHDTHGPLETAIAAGGFADKEPTAETTDPGRVMSNDYFPCWSASLCP